MSDPGMRAVAESARRVLVQRAKETHGTLADASNVAALAAARLAEAPVNEATGKAEIPRKDLDAVLEALRHVHDAGRLTYMRNHGSEEDYEAFGRKAAKQFSRLVPRPARKAKP